MIANVLFSARGGRDRDVVIVDDRVPEGDRVKDGVCEDDRVNDGVSDGDLVKEGVCDGDGEVDRLRVADGVIVLEEVRVLLSDDPDDGVGLGVAENIGAPRMYTPSAYSTFPTGVHVPPLLVDVKYPPRVPTP
jgi:hypothetical protein